MSEDEFTVAVAFTLLVIIGFGMVAAFGTLIWSLVL